MLLNRTHSTHCGHTGILNRYKYNIIKDTANELITCVVYMHGPIRIQIKQIFDSHSLSKGSPLFLYSPRAQYLVLTSIPDKCKSRESKSKLCVHHFFCWLYNEQRETTHFIKQKLFLRETTVSYSFICYLKISIWLIVVCLKSNGKIFIQ